MIDPRDLAEATLAPFDPSVVADFHDEHEPLELESIALTPSDIADLTGVALSLDRCTVTGSDLSVFTIVVARNTLFDQCKLRGAVFTKAVRNTVFRSCQLHECQFRMMHLERARFEHCDVTECDFHASTLLDVSFPASTIAGVGFDRCEVDGLDLREAADLAIADPRTLRGARIAERHVPQIALRLAQLNGIEVDVPGATE